MTRKRLTSGLFEVLAILSAASAVTFVFYREFFLSSLDAITGDPGDARLYIAVLEHWRAVLSGHAHNYQRYTRTVAMGDDTYQVPFIICGDGGHYVNLLTEERKGVNDEPGFGIDGVDVAERDLRIFLVEKFDQPTERRGTRHRSLAHLLDRAVDRPFHSVGRDHRQFAPCLDGPQRERHERQETGQQYVEIKIPPAPRGRERVER